MLAVAEYLRGIVVRHGNICRKKSPLLPLLGQWSIGDDGRKENSFFAFPLKNILLSWAPKDERNGKSTYFSKIPKYLVGIPCVSKHFCRKLAVLNTA